MRVRRRSGLEIVLACGLATGLAACGSETDRPAMVEQSTSTQEQTAAASDSAWNTFTRTADKDLGALARRLDEIREGLAEFERMEVDRWAERVKRAREEIAKEVAEAPVKRQRDRDELRREIEEIRREVAALLAKVGIGKPPPMGDESQE